MPFGACPLAPLAALLLLAGGCAGSSPAVDSSAPPAERIATYLERLDRWGYSGAALVARGDSVLAERGFGFADRERGVRNDASTIFDLASLAKQYTAAGVLLLQDRGLLSVHDSLGRFFPSVPADKRGITVHHLLTHTSGLPREVGRDWEETTRETFEQRTLDSPLGFPPGADYRYSNAGYALLGAIVERVSGIGFHEFLEREVFQRAGLARTGFIGRSPDSGGTALAGSGSTEGQSPASWSHAWNHRGSGGLLATVGDFFRWRRALLAGRVISPEAVAAMHRVQAGRYGYGVQVDEDSLGVRYEHVGLWYSFSSRFIERPSDSILVIVVSNARHGSGAVTAAPIADHLFAEATGHAGPLPPALAEDSSPAPPDLAGEYRTSTGGLIRVRVAPPGLAIDGEGQEIYDALFSESPVDSALRELLQTRAAAILLGVRDGSFDTLDLAAPSERAERYRRLLPPIWAERQDSLGPLERVEPVGVIRRGDVYETRARLRYARGAEGVALTWSAEGSLLGLANDNPELDPEQTTFRRAPDGSWASWHPELRRAVSIRFERDALVVDAGAGRSLRAAR